MYMKEKKRKKKHSCIDLWEAYELKITVTVTHKVLTKYMYFYQEKLVSY